MFRLMDIKEKLHQLDSLSHQKTMTSGRRVTSPTSNIEQVVTGKAVENEYGSFYLIENELPAEYHHGDIRISDLLQQSAIHLPVIGKNSDFDQVDLSKLLFIDTETTGLSGGAGTCAFLVGLGFFEKRQFRVLQYFMNDFHEEAAMLYEINQFVPEFECLVSYNGKSFDLPLLISRNVFQSMKPSFAKMRHFDLLHSVRRLWKHRLTECSLLNAEHQIAHFSRTTEDIPGFLIPQTYFHYLRHKDVVPLKPIFYHNQQDIVAMAALLCKALATVSNPHETCEHAFDILALGKLLENANQYDESIQLYEAYMQANQTSHFNSRFLFKIAFNYKKMGSFRESAKIWQECIQNGRFHPVPYIELAKYLEHKKKDSAKAKNLVSKALAEMSVLQQLNLKPEWIDYKKDLQHRFARLDRKAHPKT